MCKMSKEELDFLEEKVRDIDDIHISLSDLQSIYENTYMSDAEYHKEREAILTDFLNIVVELGEDAKKMLNKQ